MSELCVICPFYDPLGETIRRWNTEFDGWCQFDECYCYSSRDQKHCFEEPPLMKVGHIYEMGPDGIKEVKANE